MKTILHHCFSCRWLLGVGMSLVAAVAAQAQTAVTFQIDMSSVSPAPTSVYISGSFNGWPGFTLGVGNGPALINTSGTIWSNTVTVSDAPGTVESCKFQYEPGDNWESIPNRQFVVDTGTQVLPLTSWNVNTTWPTPTNQLTFQIDMSPEVVTGGFTNGDPHGSITVSGDFEGWDNGLPLTNNPTLGDYTSNYYTGTFPVVGFPGGTTINYKFRMNGGWESPLSTGGNNRQAAITSPTQVLPLVYYQDNTIYDLTQPITVTFSVVVTNGTLDDNAYAFVKNSDQIFFNADFLGWWGWGINAGPGADQMIEVGNTDTYTNSFLVPGGNSLIINYKYSFDGFDDENGFQTNHVREIRTDPPTYVFPTDVWSSTVLQPGTGATYPNPGITSTNIVEPDFGNLAIGSLSGGKIPITWLGRTGVLLQNNSSLTGSWTINNMAPAFASVTNWPATGSAQFFRLMKKAPLPGSPPSTW